MRNFPVSTWKAESRYIGRETNLPKFRAYRGRFRYDGSCAGGYVSAGLLLCCTSMHLKSWKIARRKRGRMGERGGPSMDCDRLNLVTEPAFETSHSRYQMTTWAHSSGRSWSCFFSALLMTIPGAHIYGRALLGLVDGKAGNSSRAEENTKSDHRQCPRSDVLCRNSTRLACTWLMQTVPACGVFILPAWYAYI
jgi:hypothetical protein